MTDIKFDGFEQGEFNSGLAIVYFIDSLKKALVQARLNNDYESRYKLLVEYYMSLSGTMDDTPKNQEIKKEYEQYWQRAKEAIGKIRYVSFNFNKYNKKLNITGDDMDSFDLWQYKLNELQQRLGIGMPKKADPRFSLSD